MVKGKVGCLMLNSINQKYDYVTIDIDTPYNTFVKEDIGEYTEKKLFELQIRGYKMEWIKIRRSASGNVHIWIKFQESYDVFTIMKLRAFLKDDAFRIRNDLRKLFSGQMKEFMILWDGKIIYQHGKRIHKTAGNWYNYVKIYQRYVEKRLKEKYFK